MLIEVTASRGVSSIGPFGTQKNIPKAQAHILILLGKVREVTGGCPVGAPPTSGYRRRDLVAEKSAAAPAKKKKKTKKKSGQ